MRNFIITEGQLNHLLEVIQTGVNNVTIEGSSLGKNDYYYYVNNPKIVRACSAGIFPTRLIQIKCKVA